MVVQSQYPVVYVPVQYQPQFDWGSAFTGIMGVGLLAALAGMAFPTGEERLSPQEELGLLNIQIPRLVEQIDSLNELTTERRQYRASLMKEYRLSVIPSETEMKQRYSRLYLTEKYLAANEKRLGELEVRLIRKQKRRKELQQMLGIRPEEEEKRQVYPYIRPRVPPEQRAAYWHEEPERKP